MKKWNILVKSFIDGLLVFWVRKNTVTACTTNTVRKYKSNIPVHFQDLKENQEIPLETKAAIFEKRIAKLEREKADVASWKCTVNGVKVKLYP